jgi:hypothetical protein
MNIMIVEGLWGDLDGEKDSVRRPWLFIVTW